MGIKTLALCNIDYIRVSLKNLPTTWGLRLGILCQFMSCFSTLKNLPTTWGLRLLCFLNPVSDCFSEKPPHHSGIIQR